MTSKRATVAQAKGGRETVRHMVATTAGAAPKVHGLSAANLLEAIVNTKPPLPPAGGDGGNSSGGASNVSGGGGDNAGGAAKKS